MSRLSGISDAMSDVLELVRMRAELVCVNEYSAPWSFLFARDVAHFHVMERGAAWLEMNGQPAVRIETGDLLIMPLATPHVLFSDRGLASIPIEKAAAAARPEDGLTFSLGGGGEATHMIAGQVSFDGVVARRLMEVLPPLIHVKAREGKPLEWLRLTSHFLVSELRAPKSGSAVMIVRLLDLLFVQAIRAWAQTTSGRLGWLAGLADPQVGRALAAVHEDPASRWSVESLAEIAGLSPALARAFKARFGQTPAVFRKSGRLAKS